MKFLSLVLVLLSTQLASAASSGSVLKNSITKMGMCVGVQNLDGYVVYFYSDNTASIGTLTPDSNQALSEFAANDFGYKNVYSKFMEIGEVSDYRDTTWSVVNSKVYVKLDGKSNESLLIGMKSKFCSVNY
jgi:hypothetical protein